MMANTAASPFNKPSADIILRSCDNVDFHAHKNILSLASSFFETMFSIPQAAGETPSGLPVVDMSEDSLALDCLLRLCYPVRDPSLENIELVGRVLEAAKKYDFVEASYLVAEKLRVLVLNHPLEVFTIACRYSDEGLALRAAQRWREKNAPGGGLFGPPRVEGLKTKWRQSWLSAQFGDTIISQCYTHFMRGRISAGPFFRLLQYIKDGTSTTPQFAHAPQAASSSSAEVTSSSAVDVSNLPQYYPFNRPSVDLLLLSQDAVSFRVQRAVLEAFLGGESNKDLESIFGAPSTSPTSEEALPTITVPEDSGTLACLLRLCHPACGATVLDWSIDQLAGERALRVYQAAQRYGLMSIIQAYHARLGALCIEEPLRAYCIANAFGIAEDAQRAARNLAFSNLRDMYCPELELLPVEHYYRLLKYHHGCHVAVRSVWNTHLPDLPRPPPSSRPASAFGVVSPPVYFGGAPPPGLFGAPSPQATTPNDAELTLAKFGWQENPEKDALQTALMKAFLEREVAAAAAPPTLGTGAYRLDWSAVLETKAKVEKDIENALQALQL